jgi:ketosteroid isomerase-like protein
VEARYCVAMSQENVELSHRANECFNSRDLDAFLALMDPSVEFTPYERAIQGLGPYCGHDGVRSWWKESFEVLPDLTVEIREVRDLGDRTLVQGRLYGQGAGSGASFERQLWEIVEWRDKKVVWWRASEGEAEALEAAGLSE